MAQPSTLVTGFLFLQHRGYPVPSPACLQQIGDAFRARVASFAEANHIPVVTLKSADRNIEVMQPYLDKAAATGRSQVAAIGVAELAIAADGGRQRACPRPLEAPEDHRLEGAIERQRVGQPRLAERPLDPCRRRRRGPAKDGDPPLVTPLDPLDPPQVGAVEQHVAVDRPRVAPEGVSDGNAITSAPPEREAGRRAPPRRGRG